ncbi:MAG: hypothetical protein LBH06_01310 [Rikenellaceae bacterium]|jgi:hypothetical protein|nr:hypothetical protein [Rikenellaceae bacterium]
MKRVFVILAAVALLSGVTSCNRNADEGAATGATGNVTISFGFDGEANGGETRAYAVSTSKPATSWSGNIKSLMLLFVDASGTIVDARSIATPAAADTTAKTFTMTNVAAGNYTGCLIANFDQGGVSPNFTASSVKGLKAGALLMNLVPVQNWSAIRDTTTEASSTAYSEAGEIFLASRAGVNVVANTNQDYTSTPFHLKRAVSMFRLRINKNFTSTTAGNVTDNSKIDLANAACALRIRRTGVGLDYMGVVSPAAPLSTNLMYATGLNTSSTPPANYTPGTLLDAQQQAWKDLRILPGGATGANNSSKFDVLLSLWAPVDYWARNANGVAVKLTTAGLVHWNGIVEGAVVANGILEVNVELRSPGITGATPPTGNYGNLNIAVDVLPWGNVTQTDLPV